MSFNVMNLTVFYEKVEALKSISLEVDRGEIVTIVGPNGAGKSTALKTISGLKKPSSGKIIYEGASIYGLSPQAIVGRGISHVPEGRRVFRDLTVFENLKMGAYLRKDGNINTDMERLFGYFPVLGERRRQRAGSLSGGEQQMLAIGRALMARPALLLLDEPSLGLSPIMTAEIAKIILEINRQNKVGIILVEQNVSVALRLADKAYVLETGSIVMEGLSKDLVQNEHVKNAYLGD